MNNEWNSEVVTEVSDVDITVDQSYDATSENPQSGTAVAQAVEQAGGTVDQTYNASSANAQSGTAVAQAVAQAGGTVDQSYNASSTNAQSGTAVAGAIAGVNQVPASTSADANKVLTVNSSGVPGWATAQGGGGSSVEAGEGLMKIGDTLSVIPGEGSLLHIGSEILGYAGESDGVYTVPSADLNKVRYIRTCGGPFDASWSFGSNYPDKAYLYIADNTDLNSASNVGKYGGTQFASELSYDITGYSTVLRIQPDNISLSAQFGQYTTTMEKGTWASLKSSQTLYIMFACKYLNQYYTFSYPNYYKQNYLASNKQLGITNPLPSYSAADAGKVLQVQSDGSLTWVTLS